MRTGDQALVKELNKSIVLNTLRQHAPISRADIAKITGLNKATVSTLVDELLKEHLVREIGMGASRGGRRPRLLILNDRAAIVVGAEIGVDSLTVVVQDLLGRPIWRKHHRFGTVPEPEPALQHLARLISEGISHFPDVPLGLRGIGVGIPGLVDFDQGVLLYAPNLGWRDVRIREWLEERFAVPVKVDNEANAGAVAEHWSGAAVGIEDVVYFSVGIGVGAGIILRGELMRGVGGMAGEIGHTTIDVTGPACACGNRGCLEVFASEAALRRHFAQSAAAQAGSDSPNANEPVSVADIARAADAGNAAAIAALNNVARYLGVGVANAINTFNPQRVVIGGPLALGGAYILNPVRQVIEERALVPPRLQTNIVIAAHGLAGCAIGAGAIVLQDLFRLPTVSSS